MVRFLLRLDGTFSTPARVALAAIVTAGFAAGFVARSASDGGVSGGAPIAQGRIAADVPAPIEHGGPTLTRAAVLPALAGPGVAPRLVQAVATPLPTPTVTPEPTATAEPVTTPTPAPSAAPLPRAPTPAPTPAGTTFDSKG